MLACLCCLGLRSLGRFRLGYRGFPGLLCRRRGGFGRRLGELSGLRGGVDRGYRRLGRGAWNSISPRQREELASGFGPADARAGGQRYSQVSSQFR